MNADTITPRKTVTFTISQAPRTGKARKTIQRLMGMQTDVQRGRHRLARRRELGENVPNRRGGRIWMSRASASSLVTVAPGLSFTIRVTPHIVPDLRSVARYLEGKEER